MALAHLEIVNGFRSSRDLSNTNPQILVSNI
jgi:hypothetical protein